MFKRVKHLTTFLKKEDTHSTNKHMNRWCTTNAIRETPIKIANMQVLVTPHVEEDTEQELSVTAGGNAKCTGNSKLHMTRQKKLI